MPRPRREGGRVGERTGGGEARRHRHAVHPAGPHRVDGDRGDERRVDPTRQPDDAVAEAVLRDVVPRRQHEGRVGRGVVVEDLGDRPGRAVATALPPPAHLDDAPPGLATGVVGEGDVDHGDLLPELREAGKEGAVGGDDRRVAVEDELVLAADEVDVDDRAPGLARPRDEDLPALGTGPRAVRRGVERQHDPRPGGGKPRDRTRGRPGVLADHDADRPAADAEDRRVPGTGDEPALLVEHAVVRQQFLDRHAAHLAAPAHGRRVAQAAGLGHVADDDRAPGRSRRHGGEGPLARRDEVRLQQQVLRRVAGEHELGEDRDVGSEPFGAARRVEHTPDIPVEVPDHRVDLAQRDA